MCRALGFMAACSLQSQRARPHHLKVCAVSGHTVPGMSALSGIRLRLIADPVQKTERGSVSVFSQERLLRLTRAPT
jgi:hypothetical protein